MTNKEAYNILTYQCRNYSTEELHMAFDLAIKALEERPQGEWITDERGYVCSECGALHSDDYPFCHMCGADMRGNDNG